MSGMKDTFGRALMAYHRGGEAEYVIERDDGLRQTLGAGDYFLDYDDWAEHERRAVLEARGRVLDVGCGAGRVSLWLQRRGIEVTAIDISPLALRVAGLRGVRDCRPMDVRRLEYPDGYFDSVVMFGNNFGIAGDVSETRRVLRAFHRVTTGDGLIIAACRDPLKTDNPAHLAYHERNRRRGRPPGLVKIRISFQGEFDDWFELLLVGEEEMREVVAPTGWKIKTTYTDGANYCAVLTKG